MKLNLQPLIGIIGGKGRMGRWFACFFRQNGYAVAVSDLNTKLTSRELVQKSDVVVFALPLHQTVAIMESLVNFSRPEQLWLDLSSIKVPIIKAMLRSRAEVIGSHPMFGPTTRTIRGQVVVVCPARVKKWRQWWESLLHQNEAKVNITTAEEHDRMMAIVQGLTHFSAITISHALKELGVDVKATLDFASPVYRIHLDMEGRILAQDPELYADIQVMNPAARSVLEQYIRSAAKLYQIVEHRDREAFVQYFEETAEHLGDYQHEALKESDRLIQTLMRRGK